MGDAGVVALSYGPIQLGTVAVVRPSTVDGLTFDCAIPRRLRPGALASLVNLMPYAHQFK
jgi:hypothetical protein